ncbi:MAG: hypothetical protein WCX77_04325, partial [Candidatus Paceibacterota bacterium]
NISSAQIFASENAAEGSWPSLNFQISLNGSLPNVLKFIEKMTNLPYLIEIHGLNIAKDSQPQTQDEMKTNTEKAIGQIYPPQKIQAVFNLKIYTK